MTLFAGGIKDSENILQQYSCGDRSSFLQLAKYAAILKREYEQAKVEKRSLKEQVRTGSHSIKIRGGLVVQ